jgi:hypothetical protein
MAISRSIACAIGILLVACCAVQARKLREVGERHSYVSGDTVQLQQQLIYTLQSMSVHVLHAAVKHMHQPSPPHATHSRWQVACISACTDCLAVLCCLQEM